MRTGPAGRAEDRVWLDAFSSTIILGVAIEANFSTFLARALCGLGKVVAVAQTLSRRRKL